MCFRDQRFLPQLEGPTYQREAQALSSPQVHKVEEDQLYMEGVLRKVPAADVRGWVASSTNPPPPQKKAQVREKGSSVKKYFFF